MKANECIQQLSPHLFWDVHPDEVDLERYPQYVIKRVLEYGLMNDWLLLRAYYGLPRIILEAKQLRELDPRALAYLVAISHTAKTEFRCYTYQQSIPTHWNF